MPERPNPILPPYSPDLNPVGETGAQVKASVSSLAPRILSELFDAVGRGTERVPQGDAIAWFQHRALYLFGCAMRK